MTRKLKVHYDKYPDTVTENRYAPICGQAGYFGLTRRRANVTCKNCKRKLEKGGVA